jgi:hypothetical protein
VTLQSTTLNIFEKNCLMLALCIYELLVIIGMKRAAMFQYGRTVRVSNVDRGRLTLEPTQPSIKWVTELFSVVKRPGREDSHSPPYSAEVKNGWSYTSTPYMTLRLGHE